MIRSLLKSYGHGVYLWDARDEQFPFQIDLALCLAVLFAVADGNGTRGGIANYLARPASDLTHALQVLEDAGLLRRELDVFRDGRPTYRIADPLISSYHAIMRPVWDQLDRGMADRVWHGARRRFALAKRGDDLAARLTRGVG